MTEPNLDQNFNPMPDFGHSKPNIFKKPLFWMIVAVVLIMALVLIFFSFGGSDGGKKPADQAPKVVILNKAEKGELVQGFPSDLVADEGAVITGSAENAYDDPDKQLLITSYKTDLDHLTLRQKYLDYFNSNGWIVWADSSNTDRLFINASSKSLGLVTVFSVEVADTGEELIMVSFIKE